MIALVKICLHRPQSVPGKAATIFALYATAGLVAALAPLLRLPGEGGLALMALLLVVAFVVGQQLVWAGFWSLFTGLLAAGTFVILTFYGAHASILAWHGRRVQATVSQVQVLHGKSVSYSYELADANGRIPGRLVEDVNEFSVGDGVQVVVDPAGWVDPETVGEVRAARPIWTVAGAGLLGTVLGSVWIGLSRPRGRPPEIGRHGLWYFYR